MENVTENIRLQCKNKLNKMALKYNEVTVL